MVLSAVGLGIEGWCNDVYFGSWATGIGIMRRSDENSIFDYLELVRERPTLFVTSLEDLQSQIWGYLSALRQHKIIEPGPSMGSHFLYYVRERTNWGISKGWAQAIEENIDGFAEQLNTFFTFVDSYRKLVPKKIATATLSVGEHPADKRCGMGEDECLDSPYAVDIMQYYPEPLHFLRFYYDGRIEDGNLLFDSELGHKTTVEDGKRWLNERFGVQPDAWQACD